MGKFIDHVSIIITRSGQIEKYLKKFRKNAKKCLGYYLTANKYSDTKTLAFASMNFNQGKQSINDNVRSQTNISNASKLNMQPLNINLEKGTMVKGHIQDLGNTTYPYSVTINFLLEE